MSQLLPRRHPPKTPLTTPAPRLAARSAIGLLNASFYIAGLLTAPLASYISDKWGRRWCIRYSATAALIGTLLGTLAGIDGAHGYALFIVSRIVFGSGISFCLMISPIMLQGTWWARGCRTSG